jgi:hypothetical protein
MGNEIILKKSTEESSSEFEEIQKINLEKAQESSSGFREIKKDLTEIKQVLIEFLEKQNLQGPKQLQELRGN